MTGENPVRESVLQAIGNTPVVRLRKLVTAGMADVLVKGGEESYAAGDGEVDGAGPRV
ncbi:MAG: hypothetical protein WCE61_10225 [Candidatus Acidiferrum sp.]